MSVTKRLLDIVIAGIALAIAAPLLVFAALGIKVTSRGPIVYRAKRMGRDRRQTQFDVRGPVDRLERRQGNGYGGREFTMYKFRTMHVDSSHAGVITAAGDPRVFPFGALLRATKIDELPQLVNVLKGDMSIVGPRPEAPEIVRAHYTADGFATLQVRPGMTSPGTVYYYTHCESTLAADLALDHYLQRLLPVKLALDRVYIERAHPLYDIRLILRTIAAIVARILGIRFPEPPELAQTDVTLAVRRNAQGERLNARVR